MSLCKCGCGQECKNIWFNGHNSKVNNPIKGTHRSIETKKKLSIINTGKHYSNETNKKKGLPGSKNPMYGKTGTMQGRTGIRSARWNGGISIRMKF